MMLPSVSLCVIGGMGHSALMASGTSPAVTTSSVWTPAPPMSTPRGNLFTATLLDAPACHQPGGAHGYPCGQVLVTGGWTGLARGGETAAADLYDPASGLWRSAGNMTLPRAEHTATLLEDGTVLVAGGGTAPNHASNTNAVDLYDPTLPAAIPGTVGAWLPTAPMFVGVEAHTAARLNGPACRHAGLRPNYCGHVLIIGGRPAGGGGTTATQLFDPQRRTWSLGPDVRDPHIYGMATLLDGQACKASPPAGYPCGNVLVAGGVGTASVELYDPAAGTIGSWVAKSSLYYDGGRAQTTASLLRDGTVLIAGGTGNDGNWPSQAERYDPMADRWDYAGSMTGVYEPGVAPLPNGDVLLAGGTPAGPNGVTDLTQLYEPSGITFDSKENRAQHGSWRPLGVHLTTARATAPATLLEGNSLQCGARCGSVLISGGGNPGFLDSAEVYGPNLTVTGLVPDRGFTSGGTEVLIQGTGFAGATTVTFDGAPSLTCGPGPPASCWADPAQPNRLVHVVSPAHAAGTAHVTVAINSDTGATVVSDKTAADVFTYLPVISIPPPALTGITVACGPPAGGTATSLTGNGLTGAVAVSFGTAASTTFSVNPQGTAINVIAPGNRAGRVPVTVTTQSASGRQTSPVTASAMFTYSDSCTSGPSPTPPPITRSVPSAPFQTGSPLHTSMQGGGLIPPTGSPPAPGPGSVPVSSLAPNSVIAVDAASAPGSAAVPGGSLPPAPVGVPMPQPDARQPRARAAPDGGFAMVGWGSTTGGTVFAIMTAGCALSRRRGGLRPRCEPCPRWAC